MKLKKSLLAIACAAAVGAAHAELPRVEGTHFYEVYGCGELQLVAWAEGDDFYFGKARALVLLPDFRERALAARERARENGTARRINNPDAAQCKET